jgi:hypothetical protein
VTAQRFFENDGRTRWLWAKIIPLISHDDALVALSEAKAKGMRNPYAQVKFEREIEVDAPAIAEIVASWALEQHTSDAKGQHIAHIYGACIGRVVFILAASGWTEWSWVEVASVANATRKRVASVEP